MKIILTVAALAATTVLGACATNAPATKNIALAKGPPVTMEQSAYAPALRCLAENQTPEQKKIIYSIGLFSDKTGKTFAYALENGSGALVSQGIDDSLSNSFELAGGRMAEMTPYNRSLSKEIRVMVSPSLEVREADSELVKAEKRRLATTPVALPDVVIYGSINRLDFIGGGGFNMNAPAKINLNQNRIEIGFDARAIAQPFNAIGQRENEQVATVRASKQLVGYQNEFGMTNFVGPRDERVLLQLSWGENNREGIQRAVTETISDYIAARTIREVTGNTECDRFIFLDGGFAS